MADSGTLQSYEVKAFLEVSPSGAEGAVSLPLTRFSCQFPINSVPQASGAVALGVDVKDLVASSIHVLLGSQLQYRTPAKVYAEVKQLYTVDGASLELSNDKIFDGGRFLLFEGYMSGSGYRRSGNGIEYTVSLEHWLSDMTVASGMSQDVQPGTADDFVFPATYYDKNLNQAGVRLPKTANLELLSAAVSADVWEGIKKFFLDICLNAKPIGVDDVYGKGKAFRSNGPAADALKRFISTDPYKSMKLNAVNADIARNIARTIISKGESTYVGHSIWDNLIVFSAALMFNVIPLIEKAVVGQKNPTLKTVYKTIKAGEVFNFDLSTNMPKFMSGLVLKNHQPAGSTFMSAQLGQGGKGKRDAVVGSYFVPNQEGTVVFQMSPEWLLEPAVPTVAPVQPPPMAARQPPGAPQLNANNVARTMRGFADRFAQVFYGNEVLKYRNGQMAGRLRLDIAPGSIIKIEGSKNNFDANDSLNNSFVAHVDSVGIYLDAAAGQASTSFGLSSIRYEHENDSGNLTTDSNPLYEGSFNGAPLHLGNL